MLTASLRLLRLVLRSSVPIEDNLEEQDCVTQHSATKVQQQNRVSGLLVGGENTRQTSSEDQKHRDGRQLAGVTITKIRDDLKKLENKSKLMLYMKMLFFFTQHSSN